MMEVKRFVCNMLQENCYVVSDETKECVIIDNGAYYQEERGAISRYIKENGMTLVHLLATHGHLDHNWGNRALYDEFGIQAEARQEDAFLIEDLGRQANAMFGMQHQDDEAPIGHYFKEDETITFGSHTLTILHTPGHSPGSCCFYCQEEQLLFTGDTLFRMSIGRTDLEGGDWTQMTESLQLLAKLPANTTVYPGHGPQTTIADEIRYNPYLK